MSYPLSYGILELFPDNTLGIGSYGKVCRAKLGQLPCAAKLLHQTMFESGDPGVGKFTERFLQEGQFLANIKHPNVVQYLATVREPQSGRPVLLMELMEESLTRFLEREIKPLPYHIQLGICHDVALALAYLHGNHIIHRDLSSNNVLLMGVGARAKVTDFGMSRLMDMNPRMTPLTQCPGTTVYMSPEALTTPPHYSDKLDCFSWGVLTVQVITGNFPTPTDATSFREDSRFPTGRVIVLVPEAERRRKDLDLIEAAHPIRPLALQCLRDNETERPSADELCERQGELKCEMRYNESLEQLRKQRSEIPKFQQQLAMKEKELAELNLQLKLFAVCDADLQEKKETIFTMETQIKSCHEELEKSAKEIWVLKESLETYKNQLFERDEVIENKSKLLEEKDEEIQASSLEIERLQTETNKLSQEIVNKDLMIVKCCRQYEDVVTDCNEKLDQKEKSSRDRQSKLKAALDNSKQAFIAASQAIQSDLESLKSLVSEDVELEGKPNSDTHLLQDATAPEKQNRHSLPLEQHYETQRTSIRNALMQPLKEGDTWYLVSVLWMEKWMKYVGYDQDHCQGAQKAANPGPIDNSHLLKDKELKQDLMEKLDYFLVPEPAWNNLSWWYGISEDSCPIQRKVAELGLFKKYHKVEVYPLDLNLCLYSDQTKKINKKFSRASTVGNLQSEMMKMFSVAEAAECRLWHRSNVVDCDFTYELLADSLQPLGDIGLHSGVSDILLEVRDEGWHLNTEQESIELNQSSVGAQLEPEVQSVELTEDVKEKPEKKKRWGRRK